MTIQFTSIATLRKRTLTQEQQDAILLIECNAMADGDLRLRRLCNRALTFGCADSISELLDIPA